MLLEGRTRTLSGPSLDLSPAPLLAPSGIVGAGLAGQDRLHPPLSRVLPISQAWSWLSRVARRERGRAWRRLRRCLDKMSAWPHTVDSIGMTGLHFHDLRHTGNQFAAQSGARLRDLMARMGHDSERAALIYQHQAQGADKAITNAIDTHVQAEQMRRGDDEDGPADVLVPAG